MAEFIFQDFPNLGYLSCKFSDSELLPVHKEVKEIKSNFSKHKKINHALAGQIEHEYLLTKSRSHLSNLILPLCNEYEKNYNYIKNILKFDNNDRIINLGLTDIWINYQKKYEFNPFHSHNDLFSFVIWLNIPYLHEIENDINVTHPPPDKGSFNFIYNDILGSSRFHRIPGSREVENTMILFPSPLIHGVYPFYTSNEYRISVAGNISIKKNI